MMMMMIIVEQFHIIFKLNLCSVASTTATATATA